jgi:hypothetical protein
MRGDWRIKQFFGRREMIQIIRARFFWGLTLSGEAKREALAQAELPYLRRGLNLPLKTSQTIFTLTLMS